MDKMMNKAFAGYMIFKKIIHLLPPTLYQPYINAISKLYQRYHLKISDSFIIALV
jgi:hypothetical protein